jgi:hypothetical protein
VRLRQAAQLHNRDEVKVRTRDGKDWEQGYVLGNVRQVDGRIIVPVSTPSYGFREVDHVDVR